MFTKILKLVLEYGPDAINLVERLFSKTENDRKRLQAAREVTEAAREFANNASAFGFDLAGVDGNVVFEALKDEERFVEEVAKVNDALIAFNNYLRSVAPAPEPTP